MASIAIKITVRDLATNALRRFKNAILESEKAIWSIRKASRSLQDAGLSMLAFGTTVSAAAAVPVTFAVQFEHAMKRVSIFSRATKEEVEALNKAALDQAKTSIFTAKETAAGMEFLARAGFKAQETISALPGVLGLAAAGSMDLAQAADVASTVMLVWKKRATDLMRINSMLVATAINTKTSVSEMSEALGYVAAYAKTVGLSVEETLAILGRFAQANIRGSRAGTMLRGIIVKLLTPTAEMRKEMELLNLEIEDTSGRLLPFPQLIQRFEKALEGVSKVEVGEILSQIFGRRGAPGFAALLSEGSESLQKFLNLITKDATLASRVANELLNSTEGSFLKLVSAIDVFLTRIGEPFLGTIRTVFDALRQLLDDLFELQKRLGSLGSVIVGVVGIFGGVTVVLGAVSFSLGSFGLVIAATKFGLITLKTMLIAVQARLVTFAETNVLATKAVIGLSRAVATIAVVWIGWELRKSIGKALRHVKIFGLETAYWTNWMVAKWQAMIGEVKKAFKKLASFATSVYLDLSQLLLLLPGKIGLVSKKTIKIIERQQKATADAYKKEIKEIEEKIQLYEQLAQKFLEQKKDVFDELNRPSPPPDLPEMPEMPEMPKISSFGRQKIDIDEETQIKLIENLKTTVDALQALYEFDLKEFSTVQQAKRTLAEAEFELDIKRLEKEKAATKIVVKREAVDLEIFKRREEYKRQIIAFEKEEQEYARKSWEEKRQNITRVQDLLLSLKKAGLRDQKELNQLEIEQLKKRHAQELEQLIKQKATQAEVLEARQLQALELDKLIDEQNKRILQRERERADEILRILDSLNRRKKRSLLEQHEFELNELKKKHAKELCLLQEKQASEAQLSEAKKLQEQEKQDLLKSQDNEFIMSVLERNQALLQLKEEAASSEYDRLVAQHERELTQIEIRNRAELQKLRELGASKQQVLQTEALQYQALEEKKKQQTLALWNFRLTVARDVTGGLANIMNDLYEMTGKKNKELFYLSKAAALAEAVVNVALGITNAIGKGGIAGIALGAVVAAAGGIQIAKIAAQTLASGGLVRGGSGTKDDVPVLAMGGEFMIQKNATRHYGYQVMQALNERLIPRDLLTSFVPNLVPKPAFALAEGGIVPSSAQISSQTQTQTSQQNINIMNVVDPHLFHEYLSRSEGQQHIINIISERKYEIRDVLRE